MTGVPSAAAGRNRRAHVIADKTARSEFSCSASEFILSSSPVEKNVEKNETIDGLQPSASRNAWPFDAFLRLRGLAALRYRDYRLLWFGHVFTSMAFWMDQVSRGWLIYELTDSTVATSSGKSFQKSKASLLSERPFMQST